MPLQSAGRGLASRSSGGCQAGLHARGVVRVTAITCEPIVLPPLARRLYGRLSVTTIRDWRHGHTVMIWGSFNLFDEPINAFVPVFCFGILTSRIEIKTRH